MKGLKIDRIEVEEGRHIGGSDKKLYFSEKEGDNVLKNYMERIMDEEND